MKNKKGQPSKKRSKNNKALKKTPKKDTPLKSVDIRPSPGILGVLPHVNYKSWNALAEYVDNSIQSSRNHEEELQRIYKGNYRLEVSIEIDELSNQIEIADNAAGIAVEDFQDAFRTAKMPDDRDGLSEFGMGMKCASCWFGRKWQIKTKHLKDNVERTVDFDVQKIVENETSSLSYRETIVGDKKPYTILSLRDIRQIPKGPTIGKIKQHLGDIYRNFIREGSLVLKLNGKELSHHEPEILIASHHADPEGPKREWKADLNFTLNDGKPVMGYAALQKHGSRERSGFTLLRRGRVIQGSGEDGYRPSKIFQAQSSFRYLRIFGELHLDDFAVSYTKDGITWEGDDEEELQEKILEVLENEDLIDQAEKYRVRGVPDARRKVFDKSMNKAAGSIDETHVEQAINAGNKIDNGDASSQEIPRKPYKTYTLDFLEIKWKVNVHFDEDADNKDWFRMFEKDPSGSNKYKEIDIIIVLDHKVMGEYEAEGSKVVELLMKFAIAVSLTAYAARLSGDKNSFFFIKAFNAFASRYIANPDD